MHKPGIPSQEDLDRQVAQQQEEAVQGKAIEIGYSLAQEALRNYSANTHLPGGMVKPEGGAPEFWREGAPRPTVDVAKDTAEFVTTFAENVRKGFLKSYEKNVGSIAKKYAKTEGNA